MIGQEWSSTSQNTRNSTSVSFPATFTIDEVLANTSAAVCLTNVQFTCCPDVLHNACLRITIGIHKDAVAYVTSQDTRTAGVAVYVAVDESYVLHVTAEDTEEAVVGLYISHVFSPA